MRKRLLIGLLLLLASLAARAEGTSRMLGEDGLSFELVRAEAREGGVSLTVACENDGGAARWVTLFAPEINGMPADFSSGWNTEEIRLEAGERAEVGIGVRPIDPVGPPRAVSLRFASEGKLSSLLAIRCDGTPMVMEAASFAGGALEPQLLSGTIRAAAGDSIPFELTDRLRPDEVALLDYGQAVIYLRERRDGEEVLTPFCTVSAEVDADGFVTADYSGLALVLDAAPGFPLKTSETPEAGGRRYAVSRVALSGEAISFAGLEFDVLAAPGEAPEITGLSLEIDELGDAFGCVPLDLFDTLRSSHTVVQHEQRGECVYPVAADTASIMLSVNAPLDLSLVSACELGEVCACFEYFFADGSSDIHAPVQVLDYGA